MNNRKIQSDFSAGAGLGWEKKGKMLSSEKSEQDLKMEAVAPSLSDRQRQTGGAQRKRKTTEDVHVREYIQNLKQVTLKKRSFSRQHKMEIFSKELSVSDL